MSDMQKLPDIPKWEYHVLEWDRAAGKTTDVLTGELNVKGKAGWEVAGASSYGPNITFVIMKRNLGNIC